MGPCIVAGAKTKDVKIKGRTGGGDERGRHCCLHQKGRLQHVTAIKAGVNLTVQSRAPTSPGTDLLTSLGKVESRDVQ
jgi:hypothetical protein